MGADHRSAAEGGTLLVVEPGAATPATLAGTAPAEPGPSTGLLRQAGRRIRAFPWRRNDLLIALGCAAAEVASFLSSGHGDGHLSVLALLLLVAGGASTIMRRRYPVHVLGAVAGLYLAVVLLVTPTVYNFGLSLTVALYSVARYRSHRVVAAAGAATLVSQVVCGVRIGWSLPMATLADLTAICMASAAGVGVRRWQEQMELNRQLLADRAVTEERRRIARELHDIVAHHITTMYLMSGGARSTLDRDPDTARAALVTLESSGRTALREMRQLLGVLRGSDAVEEAPSEPQPGVNEIDRLLIESRAAGLPVEYEELGEPRPLPPATALALYRIVQEALTNARKHAGNARAFVRLEYGSDRVTVEICDDGDGGGSTMAGGGYGLLGMRERVAVHGGTLEAGRRPEGGYRVAARVPLPPMEPGED
ncbi:sensor histidine kinase [Embleya scabrispora]|uniref:sensor histidine kinase n=1 Tax=Embleya scabrispora TaxID=159449 RepID=UPI000377874A|nr:sensor histidine kinase [Embleya scabrispora]MYS80139.1 sensor histidine kinase [Streptomyces sp. SID5474]